MTDAAPTRVGIVLVSHSVDLARGVVLLAGQMAPSVVLVAAGGTDDGGIGTSFAKVSAAIDEADAGGGAVVLSDLGSALLTAETAYDMLDPARQPGVVIVDAPFVEAAVAAAVAAESGGDLAAVSAAAESARSAWDGQPGAQAPAVEAGPAAASEAPAAPAEGYAREVTLRNKNGLHARPAAEFVKLANTFDVKVTVNGKDAKSLLGIMSLGLTAGAIAEIATADARGAGAVDALADLVESGFGEA